MHDHVYSGEAAARVPLKKLKKVKGVVIKSEWGQRVSPLTGPLPSTQYSIPEVAQASIELQLKHATLLPDSRIAEQVTTTFDFPYHSFMNGDAQRGCLKQLVSCLEISHHIFVYCRGTQWSKFQSLS